jgi:hypothetical protein
LNGGRWQGKQIVSEKWVNESTQQQIDPGQLPAWFLADGYGYQWWPGSFQVRGQVVKSYSARGRGGQFIVIFPALQMVAVFTGWNDNELLAQPLDMLRRYVIPAAMPQLPDAAIREQNLSEWRKHGYKNWLWRQEALEMAREMAAETGEFQPASGPPLTDQMAVWLTARYLMAIRKLAEKNNEGEPDLKVLREFCHDVVALRRGDHSAARLKMEQERLERLQRMRSGENITPPLTMEVSERS